MKLKINKKLILSLAGAMLGTIALSIGLSFIPTKEKIIETNDKDLFNNDNKNSSETNLPFLPDTSSSTSNHINNMFTIDDNYIKPLAKNAIKKEETIKYVAIGDSIAAGWDGSLPNDFPGSLNFEGKIEGISYPAYLALFLQKIQANKLASFHNLSKTSTTLEYWNIILQEKFNSQNENVYTRLQKLFGPDLQLIANEALIYLKEANLITVTLGANDVIHLIKEQFADLPFTDLAQQIISNNYNYAQIVNLLNKLFEQIFQRVQNRQLELIKTLKEINPKANIVFVGYPMPLAFINQLLNDYFIQELQLPFNVGKIAIDLVNQKLQFIANLNNISYINPYDQSYWETNANILTPYLFDIHPSIYGYKKMAIDIFAKLTLNTNNLLKINQNGFNWNSDYLTSDQKSYERIIELDENLTSTYQRLFTNDQDSFIKSKDELNKNITDTYTLENYYKRVIDDNRFISGLFDDILINVLNSVSYVKLDPQQKLKNFLLSDNKKNFNYIRSWMIDNKVFSTFIRDVTKIFYETDWDNDGISGAKKYKLVHLIDSFKTAFLNEEKIINYLNSFLKLPFFTNSIQREEFKDIIFEIISNFIQLNLDKSIIAKFVNIIYQEQFNEYISKEDLTTIIFKVVHNPSLRIILNNVFGALFNAIPEIAEAKSFDDILNSLLTHPDIYDSVVNSINLLVNNLLEDNEFKQIITNVLIKILNKYELTININDSNLKNLLLEIINVFAKTNTNIEIIKILAQATLNSFDAQTIKKPDLNLIIDNINKSISQLFTLGNALDVNFNVIKQLLTNNLDSFKEQFKQIIKNILNSKTLNVQQILHNFLLKNIQANNNVNISNKLNDILTSTITSNELNNLINKFIDYIFAIDKNELQKSATLGDLIFLLTKDLTKSEFYQAIVSLLDAIINNKDVINLLGDLTSSIELLQKFISDGILGETFSFIFNNEAFKNILNNFFNKALFNIPQDSDFSYLDNVVKNWLNDDSNNKVLISYIKTFARDLLANENLSKFVSNSLYNFLQTNSSLVIEINNSDFNNLMSDLYNNFSQIIDNSILFNSVVEAIINKLKIDGAFGRLTTFEDEIKKVLANNTTIEVLVLDLYKGFVKTQTFSKNEITISQIFVNAFKEKRLFDIKNIIISSLENLSKNELTKDEIDLLVSTVLNSNQFDILIKSLIKQLFNVQYETIKNFNSVYDVLWTQLKNVGHSTLYDTLLKLIEEILQNEQLNKLIEDKVIKVLLEKLKLDITKEDLIKVILIILKDNNFKDLLNQFINKTIIKVNSTDEFIKMIDLIKTWLSDENNREKIGQSTSMLLTNLLINKDFQTILNKIIYNYLIQFDNILSNINKEQIDPLIRDFLSFIQTYETNIQLVSNVTNIFLKRVSTDIDEFNFNDFLKDLENFLDAKEIEKLIISTIKILVQEELVSKHQNLLKQLLINLFNSKYLNYVNDSLANWLAELTGNINNKKTALEIIKNFYKRNELALALDELLSRFAKIEKSNLSQINNYSDIVRILLNDFSQSTIYSSLTSLISNILNDKKIENFAQLILNNKLGDFSNYVQFNLIKEIINFTFANNSIKNIIDNFLTEGILNKELDVIEAFKNYDSLIKQWFKNSDNNKILASKIQNFVVDLLKNESIKNKIINSLYQYLQNNTNIVTGINENDFNKAASDFITNTELILQKNSFATEILNSIFHKLSVDGVFGNSLDWKTEIFKVLNNNQIAEKLALDIYKVVVETKRYVNNKKTINKIAINLFNEEKLFNFKNEIIKVLAPVLAINSEDNEFKNILNILFNSDELNNFINTLLDKLFNIEYSLIKDKNNFFEIIKIVLQDISKSDIYNKFKELINFIFKNETIRNFVKNKIISQIPIEHRDLISFETIEQVIKYILDNQNFKNLLDNFFNDILSSTNRFEELKNVNNLLKVWFGIEENRKKANEALIGLAKDLLTDETFKNNLINILYTFLSKYKGMVNNINHQEFTNLINNLIKLINQLEDELKIFTRLIEGLTHLLSQGANDLTFNKFITSLREQFVNNSNRLEIEMIKALKILVNNNYLEENKVILKRLLTNILTSDISKVWKDKLASDIAFNTNNNISEQKAKDLFILIFSSNHFDKLLDAILDTISDLKNDFDNINTAFDLTKKLLTNITDSKLYTGIIEFITNTFNKNQLLDLVPEFLKPIINPLFAHITDADIKLLVNSILKNQNIKNLMEHFVNNLLFTKVQKFEDITKIPLFFKEYLADDTYNQFIVKELSQWLKSIIVDDKFNTIISEILSGILEQFPQINENLTREEISDVIDNLFISLNDLDDQIGLINTFFEALLKEAKTNFDNFNFANIALIFKEKYFSDNLKIEATILKIINSLINNPRIKNNRRVIVIILRNIIKYIFNNSQIAAADLIWETLDINIRTLLQNFFNLNDLKNLISYVVDSNEFFVLFDHIFANFLETPEEYQKLTRVKDLLNVYNQNQTRKIQLTTDIQNIIITFLQAPQTKTIITGIFNYNLSKYGINASSAANQKLINDLHAELPSILRNMNIIQPIISKLITNFDKLLTSESIFADLLSDILEAINISDYKFVQIILKTSTLNNNKTIIKDNLIKIVDGITSEPDLIGKFIKDFNIKNLILKLGLTDSQTSETIISFLQSKYLRELLHILINEIVNNNQWYAQQKTWFDAFNQLLSSTSAPQIKDLVKKWLREILVDKDEVGQALGTILAKELKAKEFDLSDSDILVFQRVTRDISKGIVNTFIFDNVADAVFESLKTLNQYKGNNYLQKIQNDAIRGALKFIKTNDNKISLEKILNNTKIFNQIIQSVNSKDLTSLINILFSKTPLSREKGIFSFLFGSNTASSSSNTTNNNNDNPFGNGVNVEISAAINLIRSGVTDLLTSVFGPIFEEYFKELVRLPKITSYQELKEKSEAYKALWRIFASLLQFGRKENIPVLQYWLHIKTTVEGILHNQFQQAIAKYKDKYRGQLFEKYANKRTGRFDDLWVAGINADYSINSQFWQGTQTINGYSASSGSLSQTFYPRDSVLTYIYYGTIKYRNQDLYDVRFNRNKTFTQVLMEDLKRGYMPNVYTNNYDRYVYRDYRDR
ncbi:GDSL-type esterase/lipase family protein [Mycoplasma sp. 744]|uniref:SGNH/GDSL hydrolase family protein n=1 Tax=Mycoplasma sp. 744 TaxID=3108531 RepID=UPI002B1CE9FE|nr:hypothetical protein [Mycoplasma sp. 744]MEA4115375.1 GDSL-type esterase/lipase family protein [Mycoplasma sp. 744]